uniref:DEP domain-containing protein n=1 Tax=Setaria digitata TaxID=48799 RepID=A0A915PNR8_9BILA
MGHISGKDSNVISNYSSCRFGVSRRDAIRILAIALSVKPMASDIRNIYKVRMNKKTFETTKNVHLNWYINAIRALFGQIGKEMYQELKKQKILALCLDEIEDEHDLAAGAKCLVQVRQKAYSSQDSEQNQDHAMLTDTPAFITATDSTEELESLTNHGYRRENIRSYRRMNVKEEISHPFHSESESNFAMQHDTLSESQNFTSNTSQTISNFKVSGQRKSGIILNKLLPSAWKSTDLHLASRKQLAGGSESFQISYLIENEIKESLKLSNSSLHGPTEMSETEDRRKLKLGRDTNLSVRSSELCEANTQKSGCYNSAPASLFVQNEKFNQNFIPLGFLDGKRRRRRRDVHRLIANHVFKSDHLIVDISKFINVMLSGKEASGNWTKTYEHITEFKRKMDQELGSSRTKVYNLRLFDLILGNEKPTRPKIQSKYKNFISVVLDFVNDIKQKTKKDEVNFRFLSPRLMPLMPDKLLEKSGLTEKDRQAVLEMVMEVSGARTAVEMALDILKETNVSGLEDMVSEATKKISEAFKNLQKSFNAVQRNDMKSRGFTFLEAPQLKEVLYQHGIQKAEDVNFDLKKYEQLSRKQLEETLWETIERIAKNGTDTYNESFSSGNEDQGRDRNKRQAVSVFTPTLLAPFMFSPTFGLSILGPVVLSPSIFSPSILNPSILGPYLLSPGVFLPFLISPYILSPYVLTPLVGAPYILSPYVLSPNVINPYLLSPLVLSPYILSPDIISPQALGGQILSPSAFSPSVHTDSVLMFSFLSPSWMSK